MPETNERAIESIYDICSRLYAEMFTPKASDHSVLFAYLIELGKTLAGADRASFWKWDKTRGELWTASATGTDRITIPDSTGLVGKALKEKRVVVTNDPYSDPDFNPDVDKRTGYTTRSVLVMPVANINGEYIGAFQIINKLNGDFDEEKDVRKLSVAALICGLALESEIFLEESHHDKLTKLRNRMGFYHDFARKYGRIMESGIPISMFICDIDKFKSVNDTYGHNAGDDVLSFTAGLIMNSCSGEECAYRWGGEEFIAIMPYTGLEECVEKAEKLRELIMKTTCCADGNNINLTLSFGCRRFDPALTIEENISAADEKLYIAKETGRNKVVY